MKLKILATAAIAILSVSSSSASSGSLIQQSHQLESIVSELRSEFRIHYDHTSIYRHLVDDAFEIEHQVEHIHRLAHDYYASTGHILRDLEEVDELAHHLHEMVDAAETGRFGHVHGNTHHVHELLSKLTGLIHKMESTVRYDASRCRSRNDHGHGSAAGVAPSPRVQIARGILRTIFSH